MIELARYGLVYLATPYSNYKGGITKAFLDTARLTARVLQAGVRVFSPICHGHPIAQHGAIDPLDHSVWLKLDEAFLMVSDAMLVAHLDGWDTSKGIKFEVDYFTLLGRPIFDLDVETLRVDQRV